MTVRTGYSDLRAAPHGKFLNQVFDALHDLGYEPKRMPLDWDDPDIQIEDLNGGVAYVDAKTRYGYHENHAMKHGALARCLQLTAEGTPVYIVWGDWRVDTCFTIQRRIIGGPRRATGNGSHTDWLLIASLDMTTNTPGGTSFKDFFPSRLREEPLFDEGCLE